MTNVDLWTYHLGHLSFIPYSVLRAVCFLLFLIFWKSFKFRKNTPYEMEMINRVSGGELGFVR
jgi:hypothetical protein